MKKALSCFLLLALAVVCAARDDKKKESKPHPDLTGTWALDKSKSDLGPFRDRPIAKADETLVIAHHDPELKIMRTLSLNGQEQSHDLAYYTDGRGETNPATFGGGEVKSKTKWDGEKVVAKSSTMRQTSQGAVFIDVTDRWQLSADGQTLTETTSISGPMGGVQDIKQVFRRAGAPAAK